MDSFRTLYDGLFRTYVSKLLKNSIQNYMFI